MKKTILTIAIVLGISFGVFAQGGGMMGYGPTKMQTNDWGATNWNTTQDWLRTGGFALFLPTAHGTNDNYNSPIGSGALLLVGFGAAYAMKKRSKK